MSDVRIVADEDAPVLQIVIASTRPRRAGLPVAAWMEEVAVADGTFQIDVVDLADVNLPLLDEPERPRLRRYQREHTFRWSATVDRASAFVFVMPEYNHGFNAPLKNALDYLVHEWAYKPVGFVSYGGIAGGTRAVQMLKPVLTALRMVAIPEGVAIPFVATHIDEQQQFQPTESMQRAALAMLDELARLEVALRPLREDAAQVAPPVGLVAGTG